MKLTMCAGWCLLAGLAVADGASPVAPFEQAAAAVAESPIDRLVSARLQKLGIPMALPCSDEVFVRRAFLDAIGTLPTEKEVKEFLADASPGKRAALIDRLFERKEYADYWALKWGDLLRIKAEFPINLWPNAVQGYHRWVRTAVLENKPYDQFAREMLTANGSNFRVPPVNFYRAVQSKDPATLAQAVALTFMGARADKWPTNQLAGMAAFFSQIGYKATGEWKEEIVFYDPGKATNDCWRKAVYPDGTAAKLSPDQDPREAFADWLISPKNPWFARAIANRAWSWLLGRGIIHEPDDIRPDNPPTQPEVLAWLEKELVASKYDLKRLLKTIMNTRTYQLSSIPAGGNPEAAAHFACYPLHRLEAEVLVDALCQITGTTETYSSAIPEPFTFIPEENRSIELPDGSISSSFLELFGRPSRDTGMESERNNKSSASQRLHLLNSSHIQRKIDNSRKLADIFQSGKGREVVSRLYLNILSRPPTEAELMAMVDYSATAGGSSSGKSSKSTSYRRDAAVDLVWALFNSPEFLYRH